MFTDMTLSNETNTNFKEYCVQKSIDLNKGNLNKQTNKQTKQTNKQIKQTNKLNKQTNKQNKTHTNKQNKTNKHTHTQTQSISVF